MPPPWLHPAYCSYPAANVVPPFLPTLLSDPRVFGLWQDGKTAADYARAVRAHGLAKWLNSVAAPVHAQPGMAGGGGSQARPRSTRRTPQRVPPPPTVPSTTPNHLTSQLSDIFTSLRLEAKLPAAVAWCVAQVKHAVMACLVVAPRPHLGYRHRMRALSQTASPTSRPCSYMLSDCTTQFSPPINTQFLLEQGVDGVDDLQEKKHAAALASHLNLLRIKRERLVNALVAAALVAAGSPCPKKRRR